MRCRLIRFDTGSPSLSCEMIILQNNSHSEIIRVRMRIFTTALRNKKISQILNENTSPYSTVHRLLSDHLLWWREPLFSELSISKFSTHIRKAWKSAIIISNDFSITLSSFLNSKSQISSTSLYSKNAYESLVASDSKLYNVESREC